jgi:hypothetical protein
LLTQGNYHGAIDPDFDDNKLVYIADDGETTQAVPPPFVGRIYRNTTAGMMNNFDDLVTGFTTVRNFYGIVLTNSLNVNNSPMLYAAANRSSDQQALQILLYRAVVPTLRTTAASCARCGRGAAYPSQVWHGIT